MRRRALVVDHEDAMRALVRLLLERRGFDVAEAADAKGALQAVLDDAPNLVVFDHTLDDIADGVELAPIIAAKRPLTRVLVTSAFLDSRARLAGVDAVLNKADITRVGDLADELVLLDIAGHG